MYWPIGLPRVYALDNQALFDNANRKSSDGLVGGDEKGYPQQQLLLEGDPQGYRSKKHETARDGVAHGNQTEKTEEPRPSVEVNGARISEQNTGGIIDIQVSRGGQFFTTITRTSIAIWQTKPTAVLECVIRSVKSLESYGTNVAVLLRPDSSIVAVQTSLGFLITYSLTVDQNATVYKPHFNGDGSGHSRRPSMTGFPSPSLSTGDGEGTATDGLPDISLRFRMVIRIDAGITRALALEDELIVATKKPAAVQCIRWVRNEMGSQTSTELFKRIPWMSEQTTLLEMVYDRPMNLYAWVTEGGKAYAVQRRTGSLRDPEHPNSLFKGYNFHDPKDDGHCARRAAINARFSLIALGLANGQIAVYAARDYSGHIPLSHTLRLTTSSQAAGNISLMAWSPDGYCLFAGYEKGWATWSVYGKAGASSFGADSGLLRKKHEQWLTSVGTGAWISGGSEIIFANCDDDRLWVLEWARSAVTGCFSTANVARSLLQTNSGFIMYRGYDVPDLMAITTESSLWQEIRCPQDYVNKQWPLRSAVISRDGKYVAVAGRRGLAHYSVKSGRWKIFSDTFAENEFTVRGGMCWHQHILIAAVEASDSFEIRLYSRESSLDHGTAEHIERLTAPIVVLGPSGDDSLLVYTYENILYHYIVAVTDRSVKLVQVGQIAFHGIIRAPARVRAVSWVLPEHQLQHGDPSQDVAAASVLFLVDAKLVLLQPATNDDGELKYDMRVVAHDVEYFALMRDQPYFSSSATKSLQLPNSDAPSLLDGYNEHALRDSLWYFDGSNVQVWPDIQDVLNSYVVEHGREIPIPIKITVDFYPVSCLLDKGIILGLEPELVQRRDFDYALFRFTTRTHLFLPSFLRHYLSEYNSPAALHLAHQYQHLGYFQHALEMLLHDILDEEAETQPPAETALLPAVLSFISSFPSYLAIIVQCTRKTEIRSWRTLFAYLPPPQQLFEESLQRGDLKTAAGYLLVLHAFCEGSERASSRESIRLLRRARDDGEWELCKDLARFLMALDGTGGMLREAVEGMQGESSPMERRVLGKVSSGGNQEIKVSTGGENGATVEFGVVQGESGEESPVRPEGGNGVGSPEDYFSTPVE